VVVHAYNPSTQEAKAGRWRVQGQPSGSQRNLVSKQKKKKEVYINQSPTCGSSDSLRPWWRDIMGIWIKIKGKRAIKCMDDSHM
jgi:hypothetical protein